MLIAAAKKKRLDFNDSIDSTIAIHELPVPAITSAICDSAPPMIPDPRYVGDIRSPHLATPRRAMRAMNLARRTIMQQRKKIETLQKKFGRCKQRISSLKDLVSDLKKRNYISEIAADNLMGEIPEIMHEVLKRKGKMKSKYSAELRAFALTLNFYSNKAYEKHGEG
ncbi:uncharacterized protein LOC143898626 [Temnothorax americanus]|uniref:uncharacterized protein LOC143898626 n=1 Tax=Temnothorax americanus TaxID=1964332 RepID=UPI004068CF4F